MVNRDSIFTLLRVGAYIALAGGLVNITLGILHFYNIWTPLYWLIIQGPFYYLFGWNLGNVIPPILCGSIGIIFAYAALKRAPQINTDPQGAGVAFIILGVISGACTWGIGGILIVVAGILSIVSEYEQRTATRRTRRRTRTATVSEPPKSMGPSYCPDCGTKIDKSDIYCFACGRDLQ